MWNVLRSLVSRPVPVDRELLMAIGKSDLFVIEATSSNGIDATGLTADALLDEVRRALEEDRRNQRTGVPIFCYSTPNGQRHIPVFTTEEHARQFCGEYSKERNRVFPLRVLQTRGTFLGRLRPAAGTAVVLNDKTPAERLLSAGELAFARTEWGAERREATPGSPV